MEQLTGADGDSINAVSAPAVGTNFDGRLEVFALSGTTMWHIWQQASGAPWSGWNSMGSSGLISAPTVGINSADELEVYAEGSGGAVDHAWQTTAGGGWSGWGSLGGPPGGIPFATYPASSAAVSVGENAGQREEVFAVNTSTAMYHVWQQTSGPPWSSWGELNATTGFNYVPPAVDLNYYSGTLEAFDVSVSGNLLHAWQLAAGAGWSGWSSLGRPSAALTLVNGPAVVQNYDYRLEAFAVGTDGAVYHIWQLTPGGGWSGWGSLGVPG